MTKTFPQMKRWTDAKLDMEHSFAILASDANDPANIAWVAAVKAEKARRTERQVA